MTTIAPPPPDVMPATAPHDLVEYLCTGRDPHGTLADDVVGNFNFPHTTFTLTSRRDLDELRARVSARPWVARVERVDSTPGGFVLVADFDTVNATGAVETSRTVTLVTLDEHHITHVAHWCTGAL